jgi:DNA-binding response OmpR family regulator
VPSSACTTRGRGSRIQGAHPARRPEMGREPPFRLIEVGLSCYAPGPKGFPPALAPATFGNARDTVAKPLGASFSRGNLLPGVVPACGTIRRERDPTMKNRLLVIDDDLKLCGLLSDYLSSAGFDVVTASRGEDGLRHLRADGIDLVVLDVMLPDMDGFDTCRAIRRVSDVPIIMLTARGSVMDRVVGLELGADDYMAKPFEPRELVARVQAILRRGEPREESLTFGPLRIDPSRRATFIHGDPVPLTTAEFDLLELLVRCRGRVLARTAILDAVKGESWDAFDRSVDVLVSRLRQKLGDDPRNPRFIRTVRGSGYAFVGDGHAG